MPGQVPPVADERTVRLGYLARQWYVLRLMAFRLADQQARAILTQSERRAGGLIKHVAAMEQSWIDVVLQCRDSSGDEYVDTFRLGPEETPESILRRYDEVAAATRRVIAAIPDRGWTGRLQRAFAGSPTMWPPGRPVGPSCI